MCIYTYICVYIYMYSIFRDSPLNLNQNPRHPLLGNSEMAKLSVLFSFFTPAPTSQPAALPHEWFL